MLQQSNLALQVLRLRASRRGIPAMRFQRRARGRGPERRRTDWVGHRCPPEIFLLRRVGVVSVWLDLAMRAAQEQPVPAAIETTMLPRSPLVDIAVCGIFWWLALVTLGDRAIGALRVCWVSWAPYHSRQRDDWRKGRRREKHKVAALRRLQ